MSGVFDLRHVLQLVIDGLDQCPLAQQDLVSNAHELSLHVVFQFGDQLNAINEEPGKQILADISLVTDQLPEDLFNERFVLERLPVIDIAWRDHEVQQITLFVPVRQSGCRIRFAGTGLSYSSEPHPYKNVSGICIHTGGTES